MYKRQTGSFKRNPLTMVSGLIAKPALNKFAKSMDYKEYGGALFLGVNKPVVKMCIRDRMYRNNIGYGVIKYKN